MRVTGSEGLLLTYLNSTDSEYDVSSILKADTDKNTTDKVTDEEKETYSAIKAYAATVQKDISSLLSTDENSIFAQAEASGNNVEILSGLSSFVDDYNKMVKELTGTKDESNDTYLAELKEYFNSSKSALEEIGLSMNDDGTISIDSDKLEAASTSTLKTAIQGSSFLTQVSEKCDYIGANAAVDVYLANASNYTASGSYANTTGGTNGTTTTMLGELYNTIGKCFDSQS